MTHLHDGLQTSVLPEKLLLQASKFDLTGQDNVETACALGLVMRSLQLLAVGRLTSIATEFPAYLQSLLTAQAPSERLARATFDTQDCLSFIELIDMLSASDLTCIAPRLHCGWQDKAQSCRRARQVATDEFGFCLDAEQRRLAVTARSLYNSVLIIPPPTDFESINPHKIFVLLLEIIEALSLQPKVDGFAVSLTLLRTRITQPK